MCAMWQILHSLIQSSLKTAIASLMAVCVLHNFCVEEEPYRYVEFAVSEGVRLGVDPYEGVIEDTGVASEVREDFVDYFLENPVPWQWAKVFAPQNDASETEEGEEDADDPSSI